MPKPIVNNRINYANKDGRIIQHDLYLNQGVRDGDSPTFANLRLTGDILVEGNAYIEGNTSILNTNVVEFKDNILLVNDAETGSGVTLSQAGIEVDRGLLENYRFVWDEISQNFMVGVISNLRPVTMRELNPLVGGIMIWNPSTKLIEAKDHIDIPITFTSTVNSTSATTGTIIIDGGLGISKDTFTNGKIRFVGTGLPNYSTLYTDTATNSFNIQSVQNINLLPSQNVTIPYDTPFIFGATSQGISARSSTSDLSVYAAGSIELTPGINKNVAVPNQTPIVFSTANEKIYTDSSNNMVIESSQNILLKPANGNGTGTKSVSLPVDTPMTFSNANQQIVANSNNDLTLNAGNNIFLNPGPGLSVRIPTDNIFKFGGSGNQFISANSNNDLSVVSTGDIYLTPASGSHVNVPSNIPVTFGGYECYLKCDTNGNLFANAPSSLNVITQLHSSNTTNSTCATDGSLHTDGGLGVAKDIVCESSIIINSQKTNSLVVSNPNNGGSIFAINASNYGNITIAAGDGTSVNPALSISDTSSLNAKSLIQLTSNFDNTSGYMIGRGTSLLNNGRVLTFNIPSYSSYNSSGSIPRLSITSNDTNTELFSIEADTGNIFSLGTFGLANAQDATNPTSAAFVVSGGLGVVKSIYTSGKYVSSVDSIEALKIKNGMGNSVFNIDTINNQTTFNNNILISTQNLNAFTLHDTNNNVFTVDTINKNITSSCKNISVNMTDSSDTSTGSYIISGGVGIQKTLSVGGVGDFYNGINMHNTRINNLLNPSMPQDAATKAYVDLIKQGLFVKDSVAVATISALVLATDFVSGSSIDGYTLLLGDRVLIKNQTNGIENGIYLVTNDIPTRTLDLQTSVHASGTFTFVENGNVNGNLGWICNSPNSDDIVDSSVLYYTQFTGLGQVNPGNAISKVFNTLNVNVDDYSIEIINNQLRLSNSGVGTGLTGGSGLPLQTVTDQSHVTKLGTINTGTWQGSVVQVSYGGTGRSTFNTGNILFGNGTNAIGVDSKLYYNPTNTRLGLGTNSPNYDFDMKSTSTLTFNIGADSDANNSNAKPQIKLSYNGGSNTSMIGMSRHNDEYANDIYPDSLVISNDQTDGTSCIQLATNNKSQLTILSNGYIGINNSAPNYTLDLDGTCNITGIVTLRNTEPSNSATDASLIITGGVSIQSTDNARNPYQGGALTVNGGTAILGDLFVGGQINTSSGLGTFAYLTITATDEAINLTSGALLTFGGITIQCTTNASSYTNGGSFLTPGGAAIRQDLYVGESFHVYKDAYINSLYFTSNSTSNFIESPNNSLSTDSFIPVYFTKYNDTSANILTINNNGLIINTSGTLQIGGSLQNPDGYTFSYDSNANLNIFPVHTNYTINIGTIGSLSNLSIFGYNSGRIQWQSTNSNLLLTSTTTQLTNINATSNSIILTTPNTSGISYIKANTSDTSSNMTLNLGQGSSSGQLVTVLSNGLGDSTVTFTPSNISSSTLVLTNNVYSTFNGPVSLTDRVEYSGNSLHQTINNTSGSSLWVYLGKLNTTTSGINEIGYCEIDFSCGTSNGSGNTLTGLKFMASMNNTTCNTSHLHYGNLLYSSTIKPIVYIYKDSDSNNQIFLLAAPYSQTNVNVTSRVGPKFLLADEGTLAVPNGTISGYTNSWTSTYTSQIESTLAFTFGDVTLEGGSLNIADNFPVIGYNNNTTTSSRDLGTMYQRYQVQNDTGDGDIVNDPPYFIDSLPNQSTATLSQIKLSSLASNIDDYYNGWWLKIFTGSNTNQVRQIIGYNGAQQVAQLATPFTAQNPSSGDTVNFYNFSYVINYYDEVNDTFSLSYTHNNPRPGGSIDNMGNANLRLKHLYATDTTVSLNATTGSIYTLGGIAISNTNDAISSTYGGTITSAGGIAIKKNVIVGNNIGVGTTGFVPQESLHIKKTTTDNNTNSTIRLENDSSAYSYIDFVEATGGNRYGIVLDSANNIFSLTSTTIGVTPPLANNSMTINSSGYVGINATSNVVSPLALNSCKFISTNSSTGYLGIIGAASNVNGNSLASRIVMNANAGTSGNLGSLQLYTGNVTSGNISMYTGNDVKALNIDMNGIVTILSTQPTRSNSSGALIVSGGAVVQSTENATSLTSGGALTVNGGVSIDKNLYLGGDLFITGALNASGSVTSPTLTFINYTNCTLNEYFNNNLVTISSTGIFTFGFSVFPSAADEDCELQFTLPGRTNGFLRRGEVIINVSGYTDDTNIIIINNVIGVGIVGSNAALIKFLSVSTSLHYFQVTCQYILA
jgi:hypothetical protein